jgi:general secretion pathway protein F
VIVSGLLVYVVPKVVTVFQNQHQALPKLTVALIAMSDFLRAHGVLLLVVLLGVAFIVHRALRRPGPRRKFHRALLHAPLLGKLVRGFNTARFTRTLSILAGSGVPVLDALRIAGEVVVNIPMREAVETTAHRVREGGSISRSLSASGLFPPMTIHLIASGEQSGELQDMLERAAANQEREIESLIGTMLGLMEPLLILIMGVVVLLIVLAILMPILQMNNLVR